jgi:hypothetical protein
MELEQCEDEREMFQPIGATLRPPKRHGDYEETQSGLSKRQRPSPSPSPSPLTLLPQSPSASSAHDPTEQPAAMDWIPDTPVGYDENGGNDMLDSSTRICYGAVRATWLSRVVVC